MINQNSDALKQAKEFIIANIKESPTKVTYTRPATKLNNQGQTVVDIYGGTTTGTATVRISHERRGPFKDDETSQGLSTDLSRFVLMDYKIPLQENDTFDAIDKTWRVGPVDPLVKFGGTYGAQAPLFEAE